MSTAVSTSKSEAVAGAVQRGAVSWPLVLLSMLGGLILAVTVGLWAYFGSTVFFEIVRTGFAACF